MIYIVGAALAYSSSGVWTVSSLLDNPSSISSALLALSLLIKIGLAPAHFIVAEAYLGSSRFVAIFLSFFTRVALWVPLLLLVEMPSVPGVIILVATITLVLGSWSALLSSDVNRLLAHSGASQMGYLLLLFLQPSV